MEEGGLSSAIIRSHEYDRDDNNSNNQQSH